MTTTVLTDIGTVVELSLNGGGRVAPAIVDDCGLLYDSPPIGVMLTNAVSPDDGGGGYTGGYCVVGCSDPMVVRLAASSGEPAAAAKLYLQKADGTSGGATDQAVVDASYTGPCPLGTCMPVGPTSTIRLRYMTWEPQPPAGRTCRRASSLSVTSSTVLVDFASAPVKSGRRYEIEAELLFSAGASGGIDVAWVATAGLDFTTVSGDIVADAPAVTLAGAVTGMGPGARLGCVGPTVGKARLRGVIGITSDGSLTVQASQHTSNGTATVINADSWFRVTEV
jgi:hypothetical protein